MARLTKRMVDAAKAHGSGWTWLGDDEVPGFGALIYGSGTKTFALRYRTRSGRQRMLKLGQYGELTVQVARDLARKEKVRVLEGEDPRAEREAGRGPHRQRSDGPVARRAREAAPEELAGRRATGGTANRPVPRTAPAGGSDPGSAG